MKALFAVSVDDAVLRRRVNEVLNMLKSPSTFFEPAIIGRVVLGSFHRWIQKDERKARPIPATPPVLTLS